MHQAIARTFRPQQFQDVLQQDVVVTTLKNALRLGREAHAYLFSGTRGSGKTTLARLFARALNCQNRTVDQEPCNRCPSCLEMLQGASLDLIEIDGASSRGIDDIRKITETIGYAPTSGRFTLYLIDEVHMLTKEAFNALLKTLEEPPPQAKFLFATTEPQKIPETIKSRCQHFALRPIAQENIIKKLKIISATLKATVEEAALAFIAERAEGSLRDAEMLLDQLLSLNPSGLTLKDLSQFFALAPEEIFHEIDQAFINGQKAAAFALVERLYREGIDLSSFFDQLIHHFRKSVQAILLGEKSAYTLIEASFILDFLLSQDLRATSHLNIRLESILLTLLSVRQKLTLTQLVERLELLEERLVTAIPLEKPTPEKKPPKPKPAEKAPVAEKPLITEKSPVKEASSEEPIDKNRVEMLLQFAAVELEGTIKRRS